MRNYAKVALAVALVAGASQIAQAQITDRDSDVITADINVDFVIDITHVTDYACSHMNYLDHVPGPCPAGNETPATVEVQSNGDWVVSITDVAGGACASGTGVTVSGNNGGSFCLELNAPAGSGNGTSSITSTGTVGFDSHDPPGLYSGTFTVTVSPFI